MSIANPGRRTLASDVPGFRAAALNPSYASDELYELLAEVLALEQIDEALRGILDALDHRFAVLELAFGQISRMPCTRMRLTRIERIDL